MPLCLLPRSVHVNHECLVFDFLVFFTKEALHEQINSFAESGRSGQGQSSVSRNSRCTEISGFIFLRGKKYSHEEAFGGDRKKE
jgi:hypothetical protein